MSHYSSHSIGAFARKIVFRFAMTTILGLIFGATVFAGVFNVTKTADTDDGVCDADCSLREAIAAANAASTNDFINFDPAVFNIARTITLGGTELTIANNGTLAVGGLGANLVTISGNNASRVIRINTGAVVSLNGLTVSGGRTLNNDWGAGILNGGSLTMIFSVISGNSSASNGGGIFSEGASSSLLLNGSTVSGNTGNGGGVYNFGGTTTINDSTITGNSGNNGGGILSTGGTLHLSGTTISMNSATTFGGFGGGILNSNGSNLTAVGTTIINNSSNGFGGGIANDAASVTISDSTISNNQVTNGEGAGIRTREGTVSLTNVTVSNNSCATCNGGGISAAQPQTTVTLTNSLVYGNAAGFAGGIYIQNQATLNSDGSIIRNNTANGGAGIYMGGGTANLTNTTITANTATGPIGGGGGMIVGSATVNLLNVTIAGNSTAASGDSGGGIHNGSGTSTGTINARNTIIADNTSTGATGQDISGGITSQGYNLIENTAGATISGVTTGNILGKDPLLVILRDNGGPTQTISLQPISPAIDAGDPANFPTFDQRGIMRAQDGDLNGSALPDIGAYERKVTTFTVTKIQDTADQVCDSDCSLREAVQQTNLSFDPDTAVLFDSSFNVPRTVVLTLGELPFGSGGTVLVNGPGSGLLTISGNNATRMLFVDTGANATVRGVTLANGNSSGGVAEGHGGGVWSRGRTLFLVNSVVANNTAILSFASGTGGGISVVNTDLFIINSTVRNNRTNTNAGGGIYQTGGTTTIIGSELRNNQAGGDGGAIWTLNGTLSITGSTIDGNSGHDAGGLSVSGTFAMTNSTVSNNFAGDHGGGMFLINCTAAITNSTISGNSATFFGGGGIDSAGTTLSLTNVTIAYNNADSDNNGSGSGGGIRGGTITARNTIIARNRAASGPDVAEAVINSLGYNLIENATGVTITGTTTGNILGQNPLLMPLRNYGGPTFTHALKANSPAVDKGSGATGVPSLDQRGFARPFDFVAIPNAPGGNGSDIGAVERQSTDLGAVSPFDFDGDGKTDIGIFRPVGAASEWWINNSSTGSTFALQFGASTDKIVPADYTGDGKADVAVFRPSSGEWYVLRSEDFSFFALPFGTNGDIPTPADYDADGKADFAVFRPSSSTWFISQSSGAPTRIVQFGTAGDAPIVADYDGDGKADIGIFRQAVSGAEWWIDRSTAGLLAMQFGASTDKAVQGDYTGDGKTDIAIWRPSTGEWFIVRSEDFSFYGFPFGTTGDVVAPGDYDGDGKFDVTVFRPSSATWFISRTTAGTQIVQFGANGDRPLPNAYVP